MGIDKIAIDGVYKAWGSTAASCGGDSGYFGHVAALSGGTRKGKQRKKGEPIERCHNK